MRRLAFATAALPLLALPLGGCGQDADSTPATAASASKHTPAHVAVHRVASHRLRLPAAGHPLVYVRRAHRASLRTAPHAGRLIRRVGARTRYGSPTVFSVVKRRGAWAGIATSYLANGELAWVKLDRRRLGAGFTPWTLDVDLASRIGALVRGHRVIRRFEVTVGAPASPTPTGRFAITDTFEGGLNPAYGCCALALTARQPSLPAGWLGGDRIAIHGTYDRVGYAESHGCIRVTNADAAFLVRHVPIGTPVVVRQ